MQESLPNRIPALPQLPKAPTSIEGLDEITEGGLPLGRLALVCGSAVTVKTTLAAFFINEICRRGGRCLFFACEESLQQLIRNIRSVGLDLAPWVAQSTLPRPRDPR